MESIRETRLKRSSKPPGSPVSLCPLNNNGSMLCSLHDMYVAYVCTSMTGLTYIQAVHIWQDYIYVMCLIAIIISTLHFVPTNTVYSSFYVYVHTCGCLPTYIRMHSILIDIANTCTVNSP